MLPPRTVVHIEASDAARRYTAAQLERERAVASAMAHHPTTWTPTQDPDSERGGAPESAVTPSPPPRRRDHLTEFGACHATVSSLADAASRLRTLKSSLASGSPEAEVEAAPSPAAPTSRP